MISKQRQERLKKIIASIQQNYTADAWHRSYPNGMNAAALLDALHGVTQEQIQHGLDRVKIDHADWPLGIAQFANLCKDLKVSKGDGGGCAIPGCWIPTSLYRCEHHHKGLKQFELDIVTQALKKHRPFVEYQIFVESTSLVSLIDPEQMQDGEKVWPEWSNEMLFMWNRHKIQDGESPMQYRARMRHEVDVLIEKDLYPLSQQA